MYENNEELNLRFLYIFKCIDEERQRLDDLRAMIKVLEEKTNKGGE